jgi:hypothetical protein
MVLSLKLFDSMFGCQSTVAPPLPTAVDFVASLPEATPVFAPANRPLFPHLPRLLDSTEIFAFLSRHHPHPIDRTKSYPSSIGRHVVADWNFRQGSNHLRDIPLGINHAERTFYNLLEFSTA